MHLINVKYKYQSFLIYFIIKYFDDPIIYFYKLEEVLFEIFCRSKNCKSVTNVAKLSITNGNSNIDMLMCVVTAF